VFSLFGGFALIWRLLSGEEGIGDALDIEDERAASKYPLLGGVGGLELCGEHIRLVSVGGHVDGALVDTLLFLAFNNHFGSAVDQWHHRELLLGNRLIDLSGVFVPGGSLELETEDVGAVVATRKDGGYFGVPVEFLLHVRLDEQLVETLAGLLGAHLLNGGEEGVRLVETVQEADSFVNEGWVILPPVKHVEALLHVVEPGVEATGRHPRLLHPLIGDSVELDILHESFHTGGHGQLSLEGQIEVLKIGGHLLNESVNQLALLQVNVLVRSTLLVRQLRVDLINWQLLAVNLDLLEHTHSEVLSDVDDGRGTFVSLAATLGLELD